MFAETLRTNFRQESNGNTLNPILALNLKVDHRLSRERSLQRRFLLKLQKMTNLGFSSSRKASGDVVVSHSIEIL